MLNLPGPPPTPGLVDPTSVRGDVIVRGASSVGKLAVGTAGQGLKSDGKVQGGVREVPQGDTST